jgi:integrase
MAKRGQNEGSIYQRNDGRWVAVVSLGWRDGKRDRKYLYGATRREVAEKLKQTLHDQQQNLPIPSDRMTVAQFLDRWLADVVKPSRQPTTYHQYADHVRLYIKPAIGRKVLARLSPDDVQRMMRDRLDAGLSPRTVQDFRGTLRTALSRAVKWGLVARNVATLVDAPRIEHVERRMLTTGEVRRFLDAAKGDRLEALFTVAVALGLRQGECLGLKWDDVDLDGRTLTVRRSLARYDGKLHLKEPKTASSRRTIDLPEIAVAALRSHKVRQLEERLLAGGKWQEQGLIFPSRKGTPYDPSELREQFYKLLKRAELSHMRFHDLRHSCASLLLAQGVPARVIMEILGHTQIGTTMNLYSHVMPSLRREAADVMDRALGAQAQRSPRAVAAG